MNNEVEKNKDKKSEVGAIDDLTTQVKVDGLGSFGVGMSNYHVGDIAGLLGLLLTIFTLIQASAAKKAAQEAASAAIKNRDKLELASRLMELSSKIRSIRDVYLTDDWSTLHLTKDHAVSIAVEIKAIDSKDVSLRELMGNIENFLRKIDPQLEQIKEDDRRHLLRSQLVQRTSKLADNVDEMRMVKVKNGT